MRERSSFLKRRARSFGYAFKGIYWLLSTQINARIHLLAICLIVLWGWQIGLAPSEWALIFLCMGLVLLAEAINTAIEWLVDLVSPEFHPLAGKIKDVAAGAVLLAVIFAALAWGFIFLPKIFPETFGSQVELGGGLKQCIYHPLLVIAR